MVHRTRLIATLVAPQGNAELIAKKICSPISLQPNKSPMTVPGEGRTAIIAQDRAMILPRDANPGQIEFRKGQENAKQEVLVSQSPDETPGLCYILHPPAC
jgi:hypothetical protein